MAKLKFYLNLVPVFTQDILTAYQVIYFVDLRLSTEKTLLQNMCITDEQTR